MPVSQTLTAINEARESAQESRRSRRMGGSTIGDPCDRKLWYAFRWALPAERHDARTLRLFQTGHWEEERLLNDLRLAGVSVFGEQDEAELCGGHFVAKIDAMASGVIEAPKAVHIVECKTHNAKSFAALERSGVQESKPMHFAQMQIYMHAFKLDRALYIAVNKDTDALYVERIKLDPEAVHRLEQKALRIIEADRAPPRIALDADSFSCRFCRYASMCHDEDAAERNCRTCLHVTPVMNDGGWHCAAHGKMLTPEEQDAGCGDHRYLPDLVPGEQIDVDGGIVVYRMRDGSEWRDGDA
jgi:CRISPR/Cas system-associated exonuclease Cas4 (RecB family)